MKKLAPLPPAAVAAALVFLTSACVAPYRAESRAALVTPPTLPSSATPALRTARPLQETPAPRETRVAVAEGPIGTLALHLGTRTFADDEVDDLFGSVSAVGAEVAVRNAPSGLGIEVGLFGSSEDVSASSGGSFVAIDGRLLELMVGPRYTFAAEDGRLEGYVGGGLDLANVQLSASISVPGLTGSGEDTETAIGGYAHAGVLFLPVEALVLGLDVRRTFGVEAFDIDFDHLTFAVMLGVRF